MAMEEGEAHRDNVNQLGISVDLPCRLLAQSISSITVECVVCTLASCNSCCRVKEDGLIGLAPIGDGDLLLWTVAIPVKWDLIDCCNGSHVVS